MLDPRVLTSIADLELVARVIVDGTVSGLHRSPFHGYSAEFSQYRHYRPGDDLKYVDWKLFGRTDRVYTKQYRESTNLPAELVLDASASMGYRGGDGVSKFEYARGLAAALAYLLASQGDALGLSAFDERLRARVASRTGQPHLRRLLASLSRLSPQGTTSLGAALGRTLDLLKRRGLLIVFSDLYDESARVELELRRAVRAGHEVALFHVLTREEVEFPFGGDFEFEDAETGATVLTRGSAVAADYRAAIAEFVHRWGSRCRAWGADYTYAVVDDPPDAILRGYLLRRSRRPER